MTEPELDCLASGSTFLVNCNPASKYYGKIMVRGLTFKVKDFIEEPVL